MYVVQSRTRARSRRDISGCFSRLCRRKTRHPNRGVHQTIFPTTSDQIPGSDTNKSDRDHGNAESESPTPRNARTACPDQVNQRRATAPAVPLPQRPVCMANLAEELAACHPSARLFDPRPPHQQSHTACASLPDGTQSEQMLTPTAAKAESVEQGDQAFLPFSKQVYAYPSPSPESEELFTANNTHAPSPPECEEAIEIFPSPPLKDSRQEYSSWLQSGQESGQILTSVSRSSDLSDAQAYLLERELENMFTAKEEQLLECLPDHERCSYSAQVIPYVPLSSSMQLQVQNSLFAEENEHALMQGLQGLQDDYEWGSVLESQEMFTPVNKLAYMPQSRVSERLNSIECSREYQ